MKTAMSTVVGALLIVGDPFATAEAAVVYDNTAASYGYWSPIYQPGYSVEQGDEITLSAATGRHVTQIVIPIFQSYFGTSGTVDAQVRLYLNDGSGGAPGTVLWDSGIVQDIPYTGSTATSPNLFSFDVPNVLVPDTFTWTIELSDVQTTDNWNFGVLQNNSPSVGSSPDYAWRYATSWTKVEGPSGSVFNYAAQVSAIVELEVVIDVKPGSDDNAINLSSAGVIPLAVLGSADFDPLTIDPATLTLTGASIKLVGKSDKSLCSEEDANGDGYLDLVCMIETAELALEPGQTVVVMEAETYDGQPIWGEDSVTVVP